MRIYRVSFGGKVIKLDTTNNQKRFEWEPEKENLYTVSVDGPVLGKNLAMISKNRMWRICQRVGTPDFQEGQKPKLQEFVDYDLDQYKEAKDELMQQLHRIN